MQVTITVRHFCCTNNIYVNVVIAANIFVIMFMHAPWIIYRLKELSDKISKQELGSPPVLRNVVVKEVVIGLSHVAFLLQVMLKY